MDYFIKRPEAYALPYQEAKTGGDTLIEDTLSAPGVMHSDHDQNFKL